MVVTCDIDFENNSHGTYFAGQTLAGRVTLKTDKQKEVKGVALQINGFACTHWTATSTSNDKRTSHTLYGREDYIASTTYLLGSNGGTQNLKIYPGIHSYNFACHIPVTCPSSFEGMYGHVRYTIKVVLERPWKFDESYTRCFTVLKIMDLNYHGPLLSMPVHTEVEKTFTCWPCGSKPMKFQLSLPQTGFVPGQEIPVGVLVTNDSSVAVEEIKITLAMLVRYYCQNSPMATMSERLVMAKLKGEGVMRQCTKNFVYPLRVPATPPTCFNSCRLIQITYQVELEAKIKGWHRNEFAIIPITIGNTPLADSSALVQQQPMSGRSELVMVPPASSGDLELAQVSVVGGEPSAPGWQVDDATQSSSTNHWSGDDSIPPPNYEQAIHLGHANLKESNSDNKPGTSQSQARDYGESQFVPLYPVFDIPSSPTTNQTSFNVGGYENNNLDVDKGTWL